MDDRIKEFCERLEFERKWLTSAGHLSSDIDIAFSAIRSKFLELFDKQESDHKCHTCKHYTSGEYDGSCGSYICKGYSNWESENEE